MASQYTIIIDAGSSSSRLYIYRWVKPTDAKIPYKVELVFPIKNKNEEAETVTALHELGEGKSVDNREDLTAIKIATAGHMQGLLDKAREYLGRNGGEPDGHQGAAIVVKQVPAYLLGTGGMRTIYEDETSPEGKRAKVILQIAQLGLNKYFRVETRTRAEADRVEDESNARVIEGEDEGRYAWVALNYGRVAPAQFAGVLEMGGASVQVAYKDRSGIEANRAKICLASGEHMVYSQTWDGYGSKSLRRDFVIPKLLKEADQADRPERFVNPCLPRGQRVNIRCKDEVEARNCPNADDADVELQHIGNGDFGTCQTYAREGLYNLAVNPPHFPSYLEIDTYAERFLGVSAFQHTFQFFSKWGGYDKDEAYDRRRFEAAAKVYCTSSWNEIRWAMDKKKPAEIDNQKTDKFNAERCFNAAWMITLLHDHKHGLGMAMTKYDTWRGLLHFPTTPDLDSRSTWTLGVAVLIARHGKLAYTFPGNTCVNPDTVQDVDIANVSVSTVEAAPSVSYLPAQVGSVYIERNPSSPLVIGSVPPGQGSSYSFLFGLVLLLLLILGYRRRSTARYIHLTGEEDAHEWPGSVNASAAAQISSFNAGAGVKGSVVLSEKQGLYA